MMRDNAEDSLRSHRRSGTFRLAGICGAFVALQITVVTVLPPQKRGVTAALLTMMTIVVLIVVAIELALKRAAERPAEEAAAPLAGRPRRADEQVSPLIQQAYHLARREAPPSYIARRCEIPQALAVLILDDVRRTARKGRAARDPFGRPYSDDPRPRQTD